MKPILEIKNLKTYFNSPEGLSRAVDGVSFKIEKGETFAIVGESGCGKSVTGLSIMQLVAEPAGFIDSGEIIFNGEDILSSTTTTKRSLRGKHISIIFQEPMTSLNPVFTIGHQIMEAVVEHDKKISKDKAKELTIDIMTKVGLAEPERLFNEYPHQLSGGMRQRVMIAMALVLKPELLIADEPTTALDVTIQAQILDLIKELQKELNTAMLLVSHNMAVVHSNADKVAVMYGGKIVEVGETKSIFKDPKHPYTKKLLSSIPSGKNREVALETIAGTVPPATSYSETGCRFTGRCSKEMADCKAVTPQLIEQATNHSVACHLFDTDFMNNKNTTEVNLAEAQKTESLIKTKTNKEIFSTIDLKTYYPIESGIFKKITGYNKAVDGISLKINKGETFAIVGESGCGKTTAGKTIMKLINSTSGRIIFDGEDITDLKESKLKEYRKRVQIIFQDPFSSLNPRLTVGAIIEEGLISLIPELNAKERKEKINLTLEQVGLTAEIASRYPHEFSGGQRQRIGIARVLAVEPEFIICDEATSALDVSVQAQILNLLKEIQITMGLSYLFITHDLGVVEYMADRVGVMYDGKIIEEGTVEEIFSNPKEDYTKKLLSSIPKIRV